MPQLKGNNCNFGTNGDAVNQTNSAAGGDGFTYINGTPTVVAGFSGNGVSVGGASAATGAVGWQSLTGHKTFQLAVDIKRTDTASATTSVVVARGASGASWGCNMRGDGKITLYDSGGTSIFTPTASTTVGSWYRLEVFGTVGTTTSNGQITYKLYAAGSTTELDTFTSSTANLGTSDIVQYRIGKDTTGTSMGIVIDNPRVGNTAALLGVFIESADLQYPTGMVTSNSWAVFGGASPDITALSDSLDTTGYQSPADPNAATAYFTFGPLTPSKPVKVTVRHMASSPDSTIQRVYQLRQGATVIASRTIPTLPTAATDFTFTTTTGETAAITDWADLRLYVTDTKN